jgi:hypothetical protein
MKTYGGVDVQIHILLTSVLVRDEWSASRPCRFTLGERASGTHFIGGWVDPRTGLDENIYNFNISFAFHCKDHSCTNSIKNGSKCEKQ